MNVEIIRAECISCGTCVDTCPEFFELGNDDNFSQVKEPYRNGGDRAVGTAPPELEAKVQDAADLCPVQIIHLT